MKQEILITKQRGEEDTERERQRQREEKSVDSLCIWSAISVVACSFYSWFYIFVCFVLCALCSSSIYLGILCSLLSGSCNSPNFLWAIQTEMLIISSALAQGAIWHMGNRLNSHFIISLILVFCVFLASFNLKIQTEMKNEKRCFKAACAFLYTFTHL